MKVDVDGITNAGHKKLDVKSPFDSPQNQVQTPNPYSPQYAKQVATIEEATKVPAEYISVGNIIASKLIFYPLDNIHIRPFNAQEVILANYAYESDSDRPIAQAIDDALFEDFSCLDLTYSDAKQLMCWLKLNSYIKTKWTFKAICTSKEHQAFILSKPEAEQPALVETLINDTTVLNTDFIIDYIDVDSALAAHDVLTNEYGLTCVPLTFRMHIEFEELYESICTVKEDGSLDDSNLSAEDRNILFIARYAKFLAPLHGDTLKEKIDFFRALPLSPDVYQDILNFEKASYHKVQEQVVSTCKGCGGEIVTKLPITPRSYFP